MAQQAENKAAKNTGKRSQAVSAKRQAILTAALNSFSQFGFHGTRIDQVAEYAGVSKTNLLYYYPSKEALYIAVLRQILDIWLAPLKAFREDFAPLEAIREYIRLKLEVSRDYPQASRLFCMEMLAGAPLLMDELTSDLKTLIDEKSALIAGWVRKGKLAPIDPHHLIFMIWASTQHYADFAPQVEAVTGATLPDEAFFNQTVENVQRMIIEGIRVR
ncbi:HTH-type transcriptional regulator RutR [Citrobacter rodentium]|uniref:Rut operon repressor (TetR-family transcriptional regulator) n=2 Tax=Citrobacter rodentium TaxID=67825 RepID=D2TT28_CITRI|nr:HTH-type transcriptional regulator RutR [Citrobacter rodentium]KIQ52005.1 transcriptional regulator [Citrobacter rodentium]QBY27703.1 HTH-type transcriptional regulator RutR [Citrobacter rodentium]UHO30398.1 HTH-type transcriptional regulator RutR [Citrobacter rodentium NBRC 105723 = DSM 16636]CBG87843.1 rut operon repressor (TetR-family transcriptional regulator) [Citrobacter rodentium ICC168]HAT8014622.1 HTH-type transcriptional regulator RutR [Citrobacter rodentium NBRC 105723 = DSM 1663